jgi:hypothetical protein
MASARRRRRSVTPPPVAFARGTVVRENLPYPVVYYPNIYGAFFVFADGPESPVYLCACTEPLIINYIRLREIADTGSNANPLRMAPLDSHFFPDVVATRSLGFPDEPLAAVPFRKGLCHRCTMVPPTLRYCHEMYGGTFKQHFGWYTVQNYFRVGILPDFIAYLEDVCPPDLQRSIGEWRRANDVFQMELRRLDALVTGPPREDIARDEITYWHNVKLHEAKPMMQLRRKANQMLAALHNAVENITRQEFGFRNVGEGWVSETLAYQIVRRLFPQQEVLRHERPDWLVGLELDIFIPNLQLALEYQGQQHFHPIQAWGGHTALRILRMNDAKKARLCRDRGVKLITLDYTEPLTEEHIRKRITEQDFPK